MLVVMAHVQVQFFVVELWCLNFENDRVFVGFDKPALAAVGLILISKHPYRLARRTGRTGGAEEYVPESAPAGINQFPVLFTREIAH